MILAAFVLIDILACFCIVFWLMPASRPRSEGWG